MSDTPRDGCPTDEELSRLSAGTVSTTVRLALAAHVEECSRCHRKLDDSWRETLQPPAPAYDDDETSRIGDGSSPPDGTGESATNVEAGTSVGQRKQLREYELLELLGQGGMGSVYNRSFRLV